MKSRSIPAVSLTARFSQTILVLVLCFLPFSAAHAQTPTHYEPTLGSLNQHLLPQWYADAKLGIFVHGGLYSVPGWAPLVHPEHDFTAPDYIKNNPYAEWYLNVMRIDGSPTQAYHRGITEPNTTTTISLPSSIRKSRNGVRTPGPRPSVTPARNMWF
jgi:hypothetical protein